MKKTILIVLMAIVASSTVMTAQDTDQGGERRGPNPEKRIEKQVKRLDKKLQLTEEQKQQMKEFYGEFDKAQKARMEQAKRAEMKDREILNSKIKSILTEEQKAKFDEMKDKEKEMLKKDGDDHRRGEFGRGLGRGGKNHMKHGSRGMGQQGDNIEFE